MPELVPTQRSGLAPADPQATPAPTAADPQPRRYWGWNVVGAGLAVQTMQGALMQQAYGTYAVALREEFGWSSTMLSAGYSMNRLEAGLVGPLHGWALQRFGVRAVMQFGTVVMTVGLILFSRLQNPTQFFGFYLIAAVGASLAGFLTVVTATVQWFERKRATALAVSQSGFAIGGLSAPILVWSFSLFGWRTTALVSAVLAFVTLMPLSLVFGPTPAQVGQPMDGLSAGQVEAHDRHRSAHRARVSKVSFTAAQAMRTRSFWMISLGHSSALLVVGAVMAHLQLYLVQDHGFSAQKAALVASVLPLVQLVGQFSGGFLGDRFSKQLIVIVAMIAHVVALLVLAFAVPQWMIWAFIPLHGLAWGMRGPLMQAMRADYFGAASFGQIMGISSLIIMLGQIGGPLLAGWMDDTTGSYRSGFVVVALLASLGVVFFALATPPPPPAGAMAPATASPAAGATPVASGAAHADSRSFRS